MQGHDYKSFTDELGASGAVIGMTLEKSLPYPKVIPRPQNLPAHDGEIDTCPLQTRRDEHIQTAIWCPSPSNEHNQGPSLVKALSESLSTPLMFAYLIPVSHPSSIALLVISSSIIITSVLYPLFLAKLNGVSWSTS